MGAQQLNTISHLDRLLLVINDHTIDGNTRFQKYAFVLSQNYKKELSDLNFYDDWRAYDYGPYSDALRTDMAESITTNLITCYDGLSRSGQNIKKYTLTIKGRHQLRKIKINDKLFRQLFETISNLQRKSLIYILKDVYAAYPQFTINSKIKDQISD